MSILSKANEGVSDGSALVGVKDIVTSHWAKYGRHFYCRYDYEGVDTDDANQVMDMIREKFVNGDTSSLEASDSGIKLEDAVEFRYVMKQYYEQNVLDNCIRIAKMPCS